MIDVRKLSMLAALDRLGTVAAVATELRLTAPGVSMQLSSLERELGIPLTERQGRRLALTPAGKLLAAHGKDVIDRLSIAEREVDAIRQGSAGTYRIAAFPSACRTFVADTWRQLITDGNGIELLVTSLEPDDALTALLAGDTDLAILHFYSNVPRQLPDSVIATSIATEPIWLAIRSDDLAAADVIDLANLEHHTWITPQQDLTCYEMTDRACGMAGYRPRIVGQSTDFSAQLEFVAAGAGVALVPDLTIAAVPDGVMLATTAVPLQRHTLAARRSASRTDAGLDTLTAMLRHTARPPAHNPALAPAGPGHTAQLSLPSTNTDATLWPG